MSAKMNLDALERAEPRVASRVPSRTKPLQLTSQERKLLMAITEECQRLLKIKGLSTYHQVNTLYCGIVGAEAILDKNWNALAQTALMGLQSVERVEGVTPFIFEARDGASRNIVSPQRAELKNLALRLSLAERPHITDEANTALCLRAMINAAIAAERGLVHIAKTNFGAAIRTLHYEMTGLKPAVSWNDELVDYARRFANAKVAMP